MKKILIILFSLLFFSLSAQAKVKSKDIKFPAGVYTDEIKSCKAIGYASLEQILMFGYNVSIYIFHARLSRF